MIHDMPPDPSLQDIKCWIIDQSPSSVVLVQVPDTLALSELLFDDVGLEQLTLDAEITWLLDLASSETKLTPDTTLLAAAELFQQAMQSR